MSHWRPALIPDLHGKRAIVTGANSGIGRSAARELARHGATVVLACRDLRKAAVARDGIAAAAPGAAVEVAKLDLADLASVRAFARAELDRGLPLDILVNNAGRLVPKRQTSADGHELTLAGNHLGHFALTGLLLSAILAAPAARVVGVSSIAHKSGQLNFDDLQWEKKYKGFPAYAASKLANLVYGLELERRFRSHGSHAQSIIAHPGLSRTGFIANGPTAGNPVFTAVADAAYSLIAQDADRGAFPLLFAATAPEAEGGHYYGPAGFQEWFGHPVEVSPAPQALDPAVGRQLWTVSEQLTGVRYVAAGNPKVGAGWDAATA